MQGIYEFHETSGGVFHVNRMEAMTSIKTREAFHSSSTQTQLVRTIKAHPKYNGIIEKSLKSSRRKIISLCPEQ